MYSVNDYKYEAEDYYDLVSILAECEVIVEDFKRYDEDYDQEKINNLQNKVDELIERKRKDFEDWEEVQGSSQEAFNETYVL